jgi:hypothetical protein
MAPPPVGAVVGERGRRDEQAGRGSLVDRSAVPGRVVGRELAGIEADRPAATGSDRPAGVGVVVGEDARIGGEVRVALKRDRRGARVLQGDLVQRQVDAADGESEDEAGVIVHVDRRRPVDRQHAVRCGQRPRAVEHDVATDDDVDDVGSSVRRLAVVPGLGGIGDVLHRLPERAVAGAVDAGLIDPVSGGRVDLDDSGAGDARDGQNGCGSEDNSMARHLGPPGGASFDHSVSEPRNVGGPFLMN